MKTTAYRFARCPRIFHDAMELLTVLLKYSLVGGCMHVYRKYIIARHFPLAQSNFNKCDRRPSRKIIFHGSEGLRATGLPCVITNHNKVKRTRRKMNGRGGTKKEVIKFTLAIKRGTLYLAWNMQMKKAGKRMTRRRELFARSVSVILAIFFSCFSLSLSLS